MSEGDVQSRHPVKNIFLEIPQNSQENTRVSGTGVFL